MSMKQIETLVFDYGGVIVNIDDVAVVKAMESLGVQAANPCPQNQETDAPIYQWSGSRS